MVREISIVIKGKPSYEKWSIYQWIVENTELLEKEYSVKIVVSAIDNGETPIILVNNIVINNIPFDEGYVIEILKKALDKIIYRECV